MSAGLLLVLIIVVILGMALMARVNALRMKRVGVKASCLDCGATWYFSANHEEFKRQMIKGKIGWWILTIIELQTRLRPMPSAIDGGTSQCPRCGSENVRVHRNKPDLH